MGLLHRGWLGPPEPGGGGHPYSTLASCRAKARHPVIAALSGQFKALAGYWFARLREGFAKARHC
jgi:hypothetical protein